MGPPTGCLLAAATDACATQGDSALTAAVTALNARTRTALTGALVRNGARDAAQLAEYLYAQSVALAFLSRTGAKADALAAFVERALAGAKA